MLSYKDIAEIFEEIEIRLISSLKRNLTRHKNEEKQYNMNWSAWQAEKLRNLDKFRQENSFIMSDYTKVIDSGTRQIMLDEFIQGMNGINYPGDNEEPQFFGIDKVKVNKLIDDVVNLEKHAETAVLRTMDDIYRQTVNKAQLAMSSGSVTLQQAIDMAVQDFLNKGINCIVYRNGRRVNIADYVRMTLRTTATRANLQGQSEKIKALGYDTILISSYSMCSETCLPWQGRVYINDVFIMWEGKIEQRGEILYGKSNYCGKWFPLLSSAIQGGLFHPNCRHTLLMWRDGDPIPKPVDNSKNNRRYKLEQHQRLLENNVRKAKRFVAGQTDPSNIRKAKAELINAQKRLREFIQQTNISESETVLKRDYGKEKIYQNENLQNGLTYTTDNSKIKDIGSGISVKTKYFDGELKYYSITDERINSIKPIQISSLSDENNQKLSNACKDLLSYMKSEPLGKEGLIAFDMNMNEITRYKAVNKIGSVKLPDLNEESIIIHNHPDGLLFSPKDLEKFVEKDSIKILGAIGNNGNTYFIEKTDDFYDLQYNFDFYQLEHKYGYFDKDNNHRWNNDVEKLNFSENFIEKGEESGFKIYISTNK